MLMQTMEAQDTDKRIDLLEDAKELRAEIQLSYRELRDYVRAMHRNMLLGFFGLATLFLTYVGFQLS